MSMPQTWRILATSVYGVEEHGTAALLAAGTKVRLAAGVHDVDPETGCGTKLTHDPDTVVIEAGPNASLHGPTTRWHVTAAALRLTDSTAPWDQPRNATTVTLRFPGARAATAAELLAHLVARDPDLLDPAIDLVHGHSDEDANCCLISWRNPSFRPAESSGEDERCICGHRRTTHDVGVNICEDCSCSAYRPAEPALTESPSAMYRRLRYEGEPVDTAVAAGQQDGAYSLTGREVL